MIKVGCYPGSHMTGSINNQLTNKISALFYYNKHSITGKYHSLNTCILAYSTGDISSKQTKKKPKICKYPKSVCINKLMECQNI